jgi:hypothetical protein
MMLKPRLLGCSCICSSRVLKPLGGKISLEEDNGILGSLFFETFAKRPLLPNLGVRLKFQSSLFYLSAETK